MSSYHKFSKNGKYLVTGNWNSSFANVYINCNWNTTGGYYLNSVEVC